ncbi:MAG: GGDEF domain-containing protein [Salinisphaera sp.]|nr:GGDEF domain-containing protein [Salinisphaera sp.]
MKSDIEKQLRLCPSLPTLSTVALKLVEIGRDPQVDLRQVAQLLSNDPALASKTLRVANSPLYMRGRGARTLTQAIAVLGLNASVSLALSFSLGASLRSSDTPGIDLDRYWRRALLSAQAAKFMGLRLGVGGVEELFLAGLLQDLGMVALDAALPGEYAAIVAGAAHEDLPMLERAALDVDHVEAGAWLLHEWGLPGYLARAARYSHERHAAAKAEVSAGFMACVTISGPIADIYIEGDKDAATARAFAVADACLGMGARHVTEVLERMAATLPELESLFDIPVLPAIQALGLTEQARELLAMRNLQLLQSASETRTRENDYRERADELNELVRRDALTGLFNRRYFDDVLSDALRAADADGDMLSVAYIDLDRFKSINDCYGHPTGDRILIAVADRLLSQLRPGDLLARYGGEEFVLLMPGVDTTVGSQVVERLRVAVEQMRHRLDTGGFLNVTLSAGVACYTGECTTHDACGELLHLADQALYEAKVSGRNCVRASQQPHSSVDGRAPTKAGASVPTSASRGSAADDPL